MVINSRSRAAILYLSDPVMSPSSSSQRPSMAAWRTDRSLSSRSRDASAVSFTARTALSTDRPRWQRKASAPEAPTAAGRWRQKLGVAYREACGDSTTKGTGAPPEARARFRGVVDILFVRGQHGKLTATEFLARRPLRADGYAWGFSPRPRQAPLPPMQPATRPPCCRPHRCRRHRCQRRFLRATRQRGCPPP